MSSKQSPRQIKLKEWHLKGVPFPVVPFADPFSQNPLVNGAVFDPQLRQGEINKIRSRVLGNGWPDMIKPWKWLWTRHGAGKQVGTGKTALLGYITHEINRDYGETFLRPGANWLAIYARVEPGTHTINKMAAQVLAGLCNDVRGTSVIHLLLARLRQKVINTNRIKHHSNMPHLLSSEDLLNPKWLQEHGIDVPQLNEAVATMLHKKNVRKEIALAIADGTLLTYLTTLNHHQNIRKPGAKLANQAKSILLDDLAQTFLVANIQHVTILLDDMYYLVKGIGDAKKLTIANDIRNIVISGPYKAITENHLFNWVAVMHTQTAPKFAAAWRDTDMELADSLNIQKVYQDENSLVLQQLKIEDGKQFLLAYLRYMRNKGAPSVTYPFTPEALDAIPRLISESGVGGTLEYKPRELLKSAYTVFSEAFDRNDIPIPITVNFVEHVLHNVPLLISSIEDEDMVPEEQGMPLTQPCSCTCHEGEETCDTIPILGGVTGSETKQILRYYCQNCEKDVLVKASCH